MKTDKRCTPCYIMSWSIRNGQIILERQIYLQKVRRYSEYILYCNTFYITQQYLRKLDSSSHWGGKLRVPIYPLFVEGRPN